MPVTRRSAYFLHQGLDASRILKHSTAQSFITLETFSATYDVPRKLDWHNNQPCQNFGAIGKIRLLIL